MTERASPGARTSTTVVRKMWEPKESVASAAAAFEMPSGRDLAFPAHVQHLQQALNLKPIVDFIETMLNKKVRPSMNGELRRLNGLLKSRDDRKSIERDKAAIKVIPYDFARIEAKERAWIQNVVEESSTDDEEEEISEQDIRRMLRVRAAQRAVAAKASASPPALLSVGLLTTVASEPEQPQPPPPPPRQDEKESDIACLVETATLSRQRRASPDEKKRTVKKAKERTRGGSAAAKKRKEDFEEADVSAPAVEAFSERDEGRVRKRLFTFIGKKEVPKVVRFRNLLKNSQLAYLKKVAVACQREQRKKAAKSQKRTKDATIRAKRIMREVLVYWKKFEKVERDQRKKAEKEALEQKKLVEEMREARRQQRKLNFLITQTELYAHFMAKKLTGDKESSEKILKKLEEAPMERRLGSGAVVTLEADDDFDIDDVKRRAMTNVQEAVESHEAKTQEYNFTNRQQRIGMQEKFDKNYSLADPLMNVGDAPQPSIFDGQLKTYQLRGMNWLASLYHQGINGILADEMGLGKTVQAIALLAHLAETQNIWGPFLVVAPASTLHNWQQEVTRFVPAFKVLPYWGTAAERKILRKFWSHDKLTVYSKDAPFHILITSYQLVIADVKYFTRIQWQYMILDEAQAIKSTSSVRWKMLLDFKCRNRLLLTGTPIQNTMAELWALLHFIMPTLFDSHAEFNEWFSKDIESHAEKKSGLDENQLSRLHLILKPFMLRRVKKDVENEMADKIEIQLMCHMTERQRLLYRGLRNKITIEELLASTSTTPAAQATSNSLMNLVMQFRKVCNHPELFERRDVQSPLFFQLPAYHLPALLHTEELVGRRPKESKKLFFSSFSIWSPDHLHRSQFSSDGPATFSFLRFIDISPSEASAAMLGGLLFKILLVHAFYKLSEQLQHWTTWWEDSSQFQGKEFLITSSRSFSRKLIFTNYILPVTSHETHKIFRAGIQHAHKLPPPPPSSSISRNTDESLQNLLCGSLLPPEMTTPLEIRHLVPTMMPSFLVCYTPKALSSFVPYYCVNRASQNEREELEGGGNWAERRLIGQGVVHRSLVHANHTRHFPNQDLAVFGLSFEEREEWGLWGCMPRGGWFSITIPDKESLVIDSGKLSVLDRLLAKLKREGHRVLIYSQMTKMIDLLEEYMYYRGHKYIRLDGSSKIADRRDMVADFQSRSDLFVFLLSTRAGGLGINLTAADTVVFYDSDWNPTVDQQAMDRAHRLGQTKQVTVYRLVTKGTVEERILQRAKEKSEIQKMVISGGHFKPDALKPKEVVSLLLDDAEMETKFLQRQAEQEQAKRRRNKRKKAPEQSLESETKKIRSLPPVPFLDNLLASPSLSSRPPSVMSSRSALSNDLNDLELDLSIDVGDDEPNDALSHAGDDASRSSFGDSSRVSLTPPTKGRGRGRGRGGNESQKSKKPSKKSHEGEEKKRSSKKGEGKRRSKGKGVALSFGGGDLAAQSDAEKGSEMSIYQTSIQDSVPMAAPLWGNRPTLYSKRN